MQNVGLGSSVCCSKCSGGGSKSNDELAPQDGSSFIMSSNKCVCVSSLASRSRCPLSLLAWRIGKNSRYFYSVGFGATLLAPKLSQVSSTGCNGWPSNLHGGGGGGGSGEIVQFLP